MENVCFSLADLNAQLLQVQDVFERLSWAVFGLGFIGGLIFYGLIFTPFVDYLFLRGRVWLRWYRLRKKPV